MFSMHENFSREMRCLRQAMETVHKSQMEERQRSTDGDANSKQLGEQGALCRDVLASKQLTSDTDPQTATLSRVAQV